MCLPTHLYKASIEVVQHLAIVTVLLRVSGPSKHEGELAAVKWLAVLLRLPLGAVIDKQHIEEPTCNFPSITKIKKAIELSVSRCYCHHSCQVKGAF